MTIHPNDNSVSLGETILWQYEEAERLQKLIFHKSYTPCLSFEVMNDSANWRFAFLIAGRIDDSVTVIFGGVEKNVIFNATDVLQLVEFTFPEAGRYIIKVDGVITRFVLGETEGVSSDLSRNAVRRVFYFPDTVKSLKYVAAGCSNLYEFPFDCMTDGITDMEYAFSGDTALRGRIPRFPAECTKFKFAFYNCKSLDGCDVPISDIDGLMPVNAVTTEGCVLGSATSVRESFFGLWGGNRAYNRVGSGAFWTREFGKDKETSSFIVHEADGGSKFSLYGVCPASGEVAVVDWGDGTATEVADDMTGALEHTYAGDGSFMVKVKNESTFGIGEESRIEGGTPSKLAVRRIYSWSPTIEDAEAAYMNCVNLLCTELPPWGASVTVARNTYRNCSWITAARTRADEGGAAGQTLPEWNVGMTDISGCYAGCIRLGSYIGELRTDDTESLFIDAINYLISFHGLDVPLLKEKSTVFEFVDKFNTVKDLVAQKYPEAREIDNVRYNDTSFEFVASYNRLFKVSMRET